MKRIINAVVTQYAQSIWHWLPFAASVGIGLSMLYPLGGGAVPDFAAYYNLQVEYVRGFWLVSMLGGAAYLYTHRDSWGFFWGSVPLFMYSFNRIAWGIFELHNPAEAVFSAFCALMIGKTFLRLRNGKIRHYE